MALIVAGAMGCSGDRCGPDMELTDGGCVPAALPAPSADKAREPTTDEPTADETDDPVGEGLGLVCLEDADCPADFDLCMRSPFDAEGYCSSRDCVVRAKEACPAGYHCMDLSIFDPGLPTACARD